MSVSGIHSGFLRKYGGFMFKQWKERYIVLTADGNLLVCRDVDSPPDQVVSLHGGCEAIVKGGEILDLPRLPNTGRRDCSFALILPQKKFLLLLAENPSDCSHWLNIMRKVRECLSSPQYNCKRHRGSTSCITDRDPYPDHVKDKEHLNPCKKPLEPGQRDKDVPKCKGGMRSSQAQSMKTASPQRSASCLRHGTSSDVHGVRAVYLLMGGAATSSALGYLGTCSPCIHDARTTNLPSAVGFFDLGTGGTFHNCSQAGESAHYHSFDFEGNSDFDGFDCGGFAF
nr:uncharacterized protein LOC111837991 [Paramormyrops kingsleyae]